MLRVKMLNVLFIKLGQREFASLEPSTEFGDERTLIAHRPAAVTLTDTERHKAIYMGRQWTDAEPVARHRYGVDVIAYHRRLLDSGGKLLRRRQHAKALPISRSPRPFYDGVL